MERTGKGSVSVSRFFVVVEPVSGNVDGVRLVGGCCYAVRMFEGGVFPRVPAGGTAGVLGALGGVAASVPAVSVEDAAGLLASLAAGGVLAGVVEGLLARLLVTVQDSDNEGSDADGADGAGSVDGEGLFVGAPGGDAVVVAAAEGLRVVGVEEAGSTGLLGLGACGLGELAAACHRLAAWAAWGESLAAACLTGCAELSAHPGQWGPGGQVSPVAGFEERRFNTTCLLSARLGVSRTRAGQIIDHGNALMNIGFSPTEVMERCGVLDSAKAFLVTRRLEDAPVSVALAVQDQVLPQAPRRTVSQVGRDIERVLMEVDPDGHDERTQANRQRRCVSRPRPAGEGLCQVRLLPAMDALLLDATLDVIAASARACGEQRTPGQIRADAVTAMTLSTLRTSQMAAYQPAAKASDVRDGAPASLDDGGGGIDGDLSTPGSAPRSWASPNSPAPGCLLPDGVPLDGLLGALSGLVRSTSPWWTPSGTGHLPLPASIHVDINVTVPITSLALPADPAGLAGLAGLAPPAAAVPDWSPAAPTPTKDPETTRPPPTQKPPTPSNQHPSSTTPHPSEAPGATDSDDQPTPLRRAARPLRLLLS